MVGRHVERGAFEVKSWFIVFNLDYDARGWKLVLRITYYSITWELQSIIIHL